MKRQASASKKTKSSTTRARKSATKVTASASTISNLNLAPTKSFATSTGKVTPSASFASRTTSGTAAPVKRAAASSAARRNLTTFSAGNSSVPKIAAITTKNTFSAVTASPAASAAPAVSAPAQAFSTKSSFKVPSASVSVNKPVVNAARLNKLKAKMNFAPVAEIASAATPAMVTPTMTAFRSSAVAFDREQPAQSLSPQKIVFQAQKFIMNDVAGLQKEFKSDLNEELDRLGIQATTNEDGIITTTFKRRGFDVEAVFDREFQFPDENDYEDDDYEDSADEGRAPRRSGAGSGSDDDDMGEGGPEPFHNVSIALMKDGQTLKMGGTLALDGDLRINSFTPYTKRGEELRTVSTEDLSDSTLNALFDALEVVCLQDETTNVLLDIARQERLKTHIDALTWMNEFFDGGDYQ